MVDCSSLPQVFGTLMGRGVDAQHIEIVLIKSTVYCKIEILTCMHESCFEQLHLLSIKKGLENDTTYVY